MVMAHKKGGYIIQCGVKAVGSRMHEMLIDKKDDSSFWMQPQNLLPGFTVHDAICDTRTVIGGSGMGFLHVRIRTLKGFIINKGNIIVMFTSRVAPR